MFGRISSKNADAELGMEYSGIDDSGRRVMGLVHKGGLASNVKPHPVFVWKIPNKWNLEEAVTVPLAYVTVIFFH